MLATVLGTQRRNLRALAIWIGIGLSLAVGLVFYGLTLALVEHDAGARFTGNARVAQYNIEARIKSYNDVLRGTASLFASRYPVSGREFHAFVAGLDIAQNFPAIETINFSEYVLDADRPALEQRMRAEQLASGDTGKPFAIFPPGRRELYHVLTYIAPKELGAPTVGFDMYSKAGVRKTLDGLRDKGDLITSGIPLNVMTEPNRIGLGIRLPIYRYGMPISTVAQRQAAYLGSVGIAFAVYRLVAGVLDEMAIKHVRMTLVDQTRAAGKPAGRVLFDSEGVPTAEALATHAATDRFHTTLPIDFRGRQWEATFSIAKKDMYSPFEVYAPWLAMVAGWVSTVLLYALFHSLTSARQRAMRLAEDMTRELRDSQANLQMSNEKLRRLAAHADQIKESERKRIAREIHDDLGQNLLALRIDADMLSSRTRRAHPRLHMRANATLEHIDATIKSVRQIINDLRPNVLDLGLGAAVEWQIAEFRRRTGIECTLHDAHNEIFLEDPAATALFRILQESLSNIVRHANATAVVVKLQQNTSGVSMSVADDGVGLRGADRNKPGSFGLVGIEERVRLLGGSCSLISSPGQGTTVCVTIPARPDGQPGTDQVRSADRTEVPAAIG